MKNIQIILLLMLINFVTNEAFAQQKKRTGDKNKKGVTAVIDSAKWKLEYYIEDRDSAYTNPAIGLKKLMGGNRRFIEGKTIRPRQDSAALHGTEGGQKPFAIIVGCSDSRVPNEIIFDQGVGDLFIVRTAGQVMAQASYGSIEFATLALGSKLIVVLGHQKCGAVAAAVKRPENPPGHIVTLINAIKPAAEKSKDMPGDKLENAIRQNVIEQVKELRDLDPVLARKHQNGEILIVGAVYDLYSGKVEFLHETLNKIPGLKN